MSGHNAFDQLFLRDIAPDRESAAKAWTMISRHWKQIMYDFYNLIYESEIGITIEKLNVPYLILRQREHWERLFTGHIDEEYRSRIARMHARHIEVGLTSTAYIISYLYLLRRFHESVFLEIDDIDEARRLVAAIDAAVSKDIARALRAYNDTEYI
jgi:hypothetical protein